MNRVLSVGEKLPDFNIPAVVSIEKGKEFANVSSAQLKGKWSVLARLCKCGDKSRHQPFGR